MVHAPYLQFSFSAQLVCVKILKLFQLYTILSSFLMINTSTKHHPIYTVRTISLTKINDKKQLKNKVNAIENKRNASEAVGVDDTRLSPDFRFHFNSEIYRTFKMKLISALKVLELECPQFEDRFPWLIILPICLTALAGMLSVQFLTWNVSVNI